MTITIYHNPTCGTSRNTLAMIRAVGIEPVVIEYLKTPPSSDEIRAIAEATGGTLRDLIREKGTPFAELDLGNAKWSDDDLLRFIALHPVQLNRPIVVTEKGTALCRPSEKSVGPFARWRIGRVHQGRWRSGSARVIGLTIARV